MLEPGRPTFSFEFFPPADAAALDQLRRSVRALQPLRPDWVSITYGATGSTRERSFDGVRALHRDTDAAVMGHLTVSGQSRSEVEGAIRSYAELGVRSILAVRGDPVGGPGTRFVPHPEGLANATELVRLIRSIADFRVGVAAFPDGHPEGSPELDAQILLDKQEAGASFAITQLFFSADAYVSMVERFRALGGTMPIVAGIMPVTSVGQIERFAKLSGAPMPEAFTRPLMAVADDPAAFREVGFELMTRLCEDVLAAGAPGLQFFTLNRSKATAEILARLREAAHGPSGVVGGRPRS
jgi:methylenetetrahydrofolate reductase (NADPH)